MILSLGLVCLIAVGCWFVHKANHAYHLIQTCRYRELDPLIQSADRYSVAYVLLGCFSGLVLYPFGTLVSAGVFGYAVYRRFH